MQTELVSTKKKAADIEAEKVGYHILFRNCKKKKLLHIFTVLLTFSDLTAVFCFVQVSVIQKEVSAKQKDCETDLAKAEPALIAATEALNTLNKVLH